MTFSNKNLTLELLTPVAQILSSKNNSTSLQPINKLIDHLQEEKKSFTDRSDSLLLGGIISDLVAFTVNSDPDNLSSANGSIARLRSLLDQQPNQDTKTNPESLKFSVATFRETHREGKIKAAIFEPLTGLVSELSEEAPNLSHIEIIASAALALITDELKDLDNYPCFHDPEIHTDAYGKPPKPGKFKRQIAAIITLANSFPTKYQSLFFLQSIYDCNLWVKDSYMNQDSEYVSPSVSVLAPSAIGHCIGEVCRELYIYKRDNDLK